MGKKITLLVLGFLLLMAGCSKPKEVSASFYLWKSILKKEDVDRKYMEALHTQKLYFRFFDIDNKGNGAIPVGEIKKFEELQFPAIPVVPVIFITNRTFENISQTELDTLANRTVKKIDGLYNRIFKTSPSAYQFDCDWTAGTKENYFTFLRLIKKKRTAAHLSCTIRLHQVKFYKKTGIPPVDRGVLMYYASSEPTDFKAKNSILDNKEASKYIQNMETYQLSLDIALPLYSWGIVQNTFGKIKLINGVLNSELKANPTLYKEEGENFYRVVEPHYLKGMWLNKDFKIKVEEVEESTLIEAAKTLKHKLNNDKIEIIFYHLDQEILKHYSTDKLQTILNIFSS